jgi:hypothetical protein
VGVAVGKGVAVSVGGFGVSVGDGFVGGIVVGGVVGGADVAVGGATVVAAPHAPRVIGAIRVKRIILARALHTLGFIFFSKRR